MHVFSSAMTPRFRYTFFIDPEVRAALAAIKARDGIPESEQIRRAINRWIEERGEVSPKTARKRAVTRKRA
jgi:dsRNA-specific ribonuclease